MQSTGLTIESVLEELLEAGVEVTMVHPGNEGRVLKFDVTDDDDSCERAINWQVDLCLGSGRGFGSHDNLLEALKQAVLSLPQPTK